MLSHALKKFNLTWFSPSLNLSLIALTLLCLPANLEARKSKKHKAAAKTTTVTLSSVRSTSLDDSDDSDDSLDDLLEDLNEDDGDDLADDSGAIVDDTSGYVPEAPAVGPLAGDDCDLDDEDDSDDCGSGIVIDITGYEPGSDFVTDFNPNNYELVINSLSTQEATADNVIAFLTNLNAQLNALKDAAHATYRTAQTVVKLPTTLLSDEFIAQLNQLTSQIEPIALANQQFKIADLVSAVNEQITMITLLKEEVKELRSNITQAGNISNLSEENRLILKKSCENNRLHLEAAINEISQRKSSIEVYLNYYQTALGNLMDTIKKVV